MSRMNIPAMANIVTPDEAELWSHQTVMTRTLAHYDVCEQIGEGTYGQVYRALCKDSKRTVALKKMRIHHIGVFGMPQQMIREIKILKRLRHPNLLQLIEVVTSKGVEHLDPDDPPQPKFESSSSKVTDVREKYKGNLFLVLEYVPHDLTGLLDIGYKFTPVQIKSIVFQLMSALAFLHRNKYIHRDIKSSNILLDSHFRLKLADFGLARSVEPSILEQLPSSIVKNQHSQEILTNKVITLWYRPPELLVGVGDYGPAVDVWSAGCILAELILGKPLLTGKTEVNQFQYIVDLLGTPSKDTWDYLQGLKKDPKKNQPAMELERNKPSRLREKYEAKLPGPALSLLERLLDWDPRKRVLAQNSLEHRYFWTQPVAPEDPAMLGPIFEKEGVHFHEFQTKRKRKEAKAEAEEAKQEALAKGRTPEQAQMKFDKVYQSLIKRVAEEGFQQKDPKSTEFSAAEAAKGKQKVSVGRDNSTNDRIGGKRRNESSPSKYLVEPDPSSLVQKEVNRDRSRDYEEGEEPPRSRRHKSTERNSKSRKIDRDRREERLESRHGHDERSSRKHTADIDGGDRSSKKHRSKSRTEEHRRRRKHSRDNYQRDRSRDEYKRDFNDQNTDRSPRDRDDELNRERNAKLDLSDGRRDPGRNSGPRDARWDREVGHGRDADRTFDRENGPDRNHDNDRNRLDKIRDHDRERERQSRSEREGGEEFSHDLPDRPTGVDRSREQLRDSDRKGRDCDRSRDRDRDRDRLRSERRSSRERYRDLSVDRAPRDGDRVDRDQDLNRNQHRDRDRRQKSRDREMERGRERPYGRGPEMERERDGLLGRGRDRDLPRPRDMPWHPDDRYGPRGGAPFPREIEDHGYYGRGPPPPFNRGPVREMDRPPRGMPPRDAPPREGLRGRDSRGGRDGRNAGDGGRHEGRGRHRR